MNMNNGTKLGLFLGCLGGIVAIIGLAIHYERSVDAMTGLGLLLLIAAMFFALGGAFSKNGQWNQKMIYFFTFLTIGVVAASALTKNIGYHIAIVECVIAVLILAVTSTPATKRYIAQN